MLALICGSCTREVETGEVEVQGYLQLCTEFEASLSYSRHLILAQGGKGLSRSVLKQKRGVGRAEEDCSKWYEVSGKRHSLGAWSEWRGGNLVIYLLLSTFSGTVKDWDTKQTYQGCQ